MGGAGGTGGNSGQVSVYNYKSTIQTGLKDETGVHGHDSPGIFAQSVGGGGAGGFSIDGSVAMAAALTPSIGGGGGAGGTGGAVLVQNSGAELTTLGDRSPALSARSVGGGGGSGGFSIAGSLAVANLGVSIGGSGGSGGTGDSVGIKSGSNAIKTAGSDAPAILAQSIGGGGGHGGFSVDSFIGAGGIGVSIGGSGGSGGKGGDVRIDDTGEEIATAGQRSPGILAQSIGGGGGHGGIGVTAPLTTTLPVPIFIGGSGGASGGGGTVIIETSSAVTTNRNDSQGILAQSIGAGGGTGMITVVSTGTSGELSLGARGASEGDGGAVQIRTTGAGISAGAENSSGIVAQSIGGGGGIGSATGTAPASIALGADNSSGSGGTVTVENASPITVAGLNSHGIVAQSIGAGGGIASKNGSFPASRISGTNNAAGDGGKVEVTNSADIDVGFRGYGIIAQSIGGGGGLVNTVSYHPLTPNLSSTGDGKNSGNGGAVTVVNNGNITTGSASAAIFAQSIGGGGGLDMTSGIAGYDKGSGNSGDVTIVHNGSITINGNDARGIFAQSDTKNGTRGKISIDVKGTIDLRGNNNVAIVTSGGIAGINVNSNAKLSITSDDVTKPATVFQSEGLGTTISNWGRITTDGQLFKAQPYAHYSFDNYNYVEAKNIALSGASRFTQYSGVVNIEGGTIDISGSTDASQSPPQYNLIDGVLSARTMTIATGSGPSGYHGTFIQQGGTTNLTSLTVGGESVNKGEYHMMKGKLSSQSIVVLSGGYFYTYVSAEEIKTTSLEINGGYLGGSGTLSAFVLNGGVLNPGNSPGTLTIDGSYTKASSGTLIAEIASATEYDKLKVIGTPGTIDLTAGGDILRPVLLRGTYRPPSGQVFPAIAEAEGGITGTFDSIQGNSALTLTWDVVYHPGSVDLVLTGRDYTNPAIGLTPNQQATGKLFNAVSDSATGDLAWVLNNLDYLESPASVRDAYRQMTPEKAASLSAISLRTASFRMQEQARRLIDQRITGFTGLSGSGLTVRYRDGEPLMIASASDDLSGLLAPRSSQDKPWGFYLRPLVNWGGEETTADQTGYRFTTAGFTAGIDYRVSDGLTLGVSTGFNHTEERFQGSGGAAETKTLPLSVYGLYGGTPWYAYGSFGYALNLYTLERDVRFGGIDRTAKSDTKGHLVHTYGEAGYDLKTGRLIVTPVVSLSYSGLWIDGYAERGADALNLTVDAQRADSFQSGCGLRLSLPVTRPYATLIPQVFAAYQHEYANGTRNIQATISQAGTFTFRTDEPKRDFVTAGAKVSIAKGRNLFLDLDYTTDLGMGSSASHALSAGVRWRF